MENSRYVIHEYLGDQKRKSHVVRYIRDRCLKSDGHALALMSGGTGSGKSYSALRICEQVDPFFTADRIVFSVADFAKLMAKPYPKGSAFMFEEAQHGAHNLNFWSKSNKGLFYLLSTLRHRNYFTIFTLPSTNSFDSQSKSLFHLDIRTTGEINKRAQAVKCDIYFPNNSQFKKNKVYFNRLKVNEKGIRGEVRKVWIKKPSKEILKAYTQKKHSFTRNLSKKVAMSLEEVQVKSLENELKE